MDAKQRVIGTIKREPVDRVPLDGHFSMDIWEQLFQHFGTRDREQIMNELGIDVRKVAIEPGEEFQQVADPVLFDAPVGMGPDNLAVPLDDGRYRDEWGIVRSVNLETLMVHYDIHPLEDAETTGELEGYSFPDPEEACRYRNVKEGVARYGSEYPVSCSTMTFFKNVWYLRGFEQSLEDLYMNPDMVEVLLDRIFEFKRMEAGKLLQAGIDILEMNGDIAAQQTMLFNPDLWRKVFKPWYAKLFKVLRKQKPDILFKFHSDGNIEDVFGDLIDVGFDIINPIQPEAMNIKRVKQQYGERVCLHGGISVQQTMPFGKPEDVREEVKDRLSVLGSGGGYILAPSHVILPDVPLENVLTLYKTARELG